MTTNEVNLAKIFQSVTQALSQNQQALNQADDYNGNHGTNMVQTFQTITNALQKKQGSSDSTALNYAAKTLSKSANSGSAKLYAENLAQAAGQFKGKPVDAQGALQLLQMLIGGGTQAPDQPNRSGGDLLGALLGGGMQQGSQQPDQSGGGDSLSSLLGGLLGGGGQDQQPDQSAGADPLSSLLGGLLGGGGQDTQQPDQSAGADPLSSLLGGLLGGGGQQQSSQAGGGDLIGTLLSALLSGGGLQSLVQSFLGGSRMGDATHRTQSTQVVVNSFLQTLGGLVNK